MNGTLRELQRKILEIFISVKKICDDNGLRYFAIGGTCLGAVRHQGFIPWDDDLDIAMPDRDYEIFTEIAPQVLPSNLKLILPKDRAHCAIFFCKVHDIETTFIEHSEMEYPEEHKGVFIDIMPLCGVPSGRIRRRLYMNTVWWLCALNQRRKTKLKYFPSMHAKILWILTKPANCLVRRDLWLDLWERLTGKYSFDDEMYTGYVWGKLTNRLIFEKELFDSYEELPFEDTTIRCPTGWDSYLSIQFGNYMKLPPEGKRISHQEGSIIDIHTAYKDYGGKEEYSNA